MRDLLPSRCRRLAALLAASAILGTSARAQVAARPGADSTKRATTLLVGTVVDVVGRPIGAAEVYIAGTGRTARTDARGVWRIPDPPPGPRVVVARLVGFIPYVREVLVGGATNDTVSLLLRRLPTTLTPVQITARVAMVTSSADIIADRLMQMRVGTGRLFTREQILVQRPYSIAELVFGVPGVAIRRGQGEIVATTTRAGVGVMNVEGQLCQLQFFLDNTAIDNESVAALDPLTFRSVEVYPQVVQLTGLAMRPDRCGAIVINSIRR